MNSPRKNVLSLRIKNKITEDLREESFLSLPILPTESDLCARYNASRETIRKSLRLLQEERILKHIPGKGVWFDISAGRVSDRNDEIQIITTFPYSEDDYYYKEILAGFFQGSQMHNISLRFVESDANTSIKAEDINCPTVIWAGKYEKLETFYELMQLKKNFVVLSCSYDDKDIPCIDCDNQQGIQQAVDHLRSFGHKRIGIAARKVDFALNHLQRIASTKQILKRYESNLKYDPLFFISENWKLGEKPNPDKLLSWLEENGITALITIDHGTLALCKMCFADKLEIPNDLSLVSFDNPEFAMGYTPPVTCIAQPLIEMGKRVIERLASGAPVYETELFETKLVERSSVSNLKSGN